MAEEFIYQEVKVDNKKLKVKDLVSIGVFAVIYFALMFGKYWSCKR